MRYLLVCLMFLSCMNTAALGKNACQSRTEAHKDFCGNLNETTCGVHSGVCQWQEEAIKVIVVKEEKCEAKDGMEAQESFCNKLSKFHCKNQKSLCVWK